MYNYEDLGSFMTRIPSLPINLFYEKLSDKNSCDDLPFQNNLNKYEKKFYEGINIASKDLFETIKAFKAGEKVRDKNYLLNSVYKYFTRCTSRCTPFGLFSGINFGQFGDSTKFELEDETLIKNVTPDFEWLYQLINKIETEYFKKLKYKVNEGILYKKGRAFLLNFSHESAYLDDEDKKRTVQYKNIKCTKALNLILDLCNEFVDFSLIVEELQKAYPKGEKSFFENYIYSLIKNEYLVSDLKVPITGSDQLNLLISKLHEHDIPSEDLIKVRALIEKYNTSKDNSMSVYNDLVSLMENLQKSKYYLCVDCKANFKENKLDKNILKNINKLLNLYLKFDSEVLNQNWLDYKNKYMEKYGFREVPLLEVLDNDFGIGYPEGYLKLNDMNVKLTESPKARDLSKYFAKMYENAIANNTNIEIKDSDIEKIFPKDYKVKELSIPDSLEVKFMYMENESKPVCIFYDGICGSDSACRSYGRFSYLFSDYNSVCKSMNDKLVDHNNSVTCEITFLPSLLRNVNIMKQQNVNDCEIALSVNNSRSKENQILLNDIVIGIDGNEKFYLKSKKTGKFIIPKMSNMYNKNLLPPVLKFLIDIKKSDQCFWHINPWDRIFSYFSHTPEIKYKNLIIQPATWKMSRDLLNLDKHDGFSEFKDKVTDYITKNNMPKYVYLTQVDNKLLLNLNNDRCLSILYSFLTKPNSEVVLRKFYSEFEQPVKYQNNSYCCEFYIPLVRSNSYKTMNNMNKILETQVDSYSDIRLITPFSDWLCFNIYGINDEVETLLGNDIFDFSNELLKNKEIEKYFFIRYIDTKNHIRLRFNAPEKKLLNIYPNIKMWLDNLIKNRIISNYNINSYDREIERYGGTKLIEDAEQIFFCDSMVAQNIIKLKLDKEISFSDEFIGIVSMCKYMIQFGLDINDMYQFLKCDIPNKSYRDEFKKHRDLYLNTVINLINNNNEDNNIAKLLEILEIRNSAIDNYLEKFDKILNYNKSLKLGILDSLIHMNMNRIFGTDLEKESKIRILTRHIIHDIYSINKNKNIINL